MKTKNGLARIWMAAVGSVCSLLGLAWPGAATVPPDAGDGAAAGPKSRAARLEPERLKAHEIAFDDAAGIKNRGAVAQEPDGRFRGVIAQSDGKTRGVIEEPAAKDKATILPPPTPPTKEKAIHDYSPTPSAKERELHQAPPAPQDKAYSHVFEPKDKAIHDYSPTPAAKDKAIMIVDPGQEKGHFIPPPPPKEGVIGEKPGSFFDSQEKGHFIPPPPPKDTAFEKSEPGKKDKAFIFESAPPREGVVIDPGQPTPPKSTLPAIQAPGRQVPIDPKTKTAPDGPPQTESKPGPPSKDHRCDHFVSPPSRDEAIDEQLIHPPAPQAPAPGPQSLRPGIDYSLLLTQEQKDHVVMGIRDRLWTLNAEGKLERRLAGGVRAVMQEGGWVEVYNAEGHLLSAYQDVRAERIDRATRITDRMKQAVLKMKG